MLSDWGSEGCRNSRMMGCVIEGWRGWWVGGLVDCWVVGSLACWIVGLLACRRALLGSRFGQALLWSEQLQMAILILSMSGGMLSSLVLLGYWLGLFQKFSSIERSHLEKGNDYVC